MTEKTPKIITTEDGSHSLYNEKLNETYHSFHGAHQESNHVFIQSGLTYLIQTKKLNPINILEVGFGTGLNAILSLQSADRHQVQINYETLENYPLPGEIVDSLNYKDFLMKEEYHAYFDQIHRVPWNKKVDIMCNFRISKMLTDVQDYTSAKQFDLVYFDAFAPSKQPELWTVAILKQIANCMVNKGILVTYCAKGQFKRDLESLGFEVETLPGPPGKKEMTRASLIRP